MENRTVTQPSYTCTKYVIGPKRELRVKQPEW